MSADRKTPGAIATRNDKAGEKKPDAGSGSSGEGAQTALQAMLRKRKLQAEADDAPDSVPPTPAAP
jgi:hypothetical protein